MKHGVWDAVVVGGGVGGLTSTAYLARAGKSVLLLEKERECGGLVRSFSRNGFTYDAGIRALEDSGIVFPMLRQLGLEIDFRPNPVSLGVEDRLLRLPESGSAEAYERFLIDLFPESASDVHAIADDVRRIMGYMDVLYGIENPAFLDMTKDRDYMVRRILPWMVRYLFTAPKIARLQEPVDEYLARKTGNRVLLDMIAQHFFRKTPTFFAMSYISLYLDYHYPAGGTGTLTRRLTEYCEERGATVRTGAAVTGVDVVARTLTVADGGRHEYRELVWAADQNSLQSAIGSAGAAGPALRRRVNDRAARIAGKRGGDSVLTLFLGVNLPPDYFAAICTGHFFYTPSRIGLSTLPVFDRGCDAAELRRWLDAYLALNTYEISIPVLRDEALAPPGQSGLVVSVLLDYDVALRARELGWYEEFKTACEETMIATLDASVFPGLATSIVDRFSSTPLTMARIAGTTDGAITGWAFTNDSLPAESRLMRIFAATKTPYPHVSQAGQWTYSPAGMPIAILTGKLAADRVMKRLRRTGRSRREPGAVR